MSNSSASNATPKTGLLKVMAVVEDNSEFLGSVETDHPDLYKRAMGGRGDKNPVLLKGEELRAAVEKKLNEEDSDLED
ncbi:hypothetical protein E8E11_002350 [Didymella keratinophila]|nr:hypothetical protein E8E11_002350 [Didymella keratinophila]